MIKGVFFDLGGTLYSYRDIPRVTISLLYQANEKLSMSASPEDIKKSYQEATVQIANAYSDKIYYLHEDLFKDIFMLFCRLLGGKLTREALAWYIKAHREAVTNCLILKKDALTTLRTLKEKGLYLSIVSNIDNDMLRPILKKNQLHDYINHAISSEDSNSCKPHSQIFKDAVQLSDLELSSILFVGDSPEHDINGATSIGLKTALISDGGMPPPLQSGKAGIPPDFTINHLSDLIGIVENDTH
jgi:HAD superfamily hydrolase (TIGR01549 family)